MVTEIREFFKCEVNVVATSINVDNINIEFNQMVLYREDDDSTIIIKDRRVELNPIRTCDGLKVEILILNEGEELEERIDWLIDEDYEIETIDLLIQNNTSKKEYEYTINNYIGEQVQREVEIEVSLPLKKAIEYVSSSLPRELNNHIYEVMVESEELVEMINAIANIEVV